METDSTDETLVKATEPADITASEASKVVEKSSAGKHVTFGFTLSSLLGSPAKDTATVEHSTDVIVFEDDTAQSNTM